MTPIDSVELSGYLDGELSPERTEAVRRALAEDPALAKQFSALQSLDRDWKSAGMAVAFSPQVSLRRRLWHYRALSAATVVGLLGLRMLLKVSPLYLGLTVEAIGLLVTLFWGVNRMLKASEEDRWLILRQTAGSVG
jgi:anti-sigma factor RsiW